MFVDDDCDSALAASELASGLLSIFPEAQTLALAPTRFPIPMDDLDVAGLAKLREISLGNWESDAKTFQSLLHAIFEQEVVNVERITVDLAEEEEIAPIFVHPHPRFCTEELRKRLNREFCVEFT